MAMVYKGGMVQFSKQSSLIFDFHTSFTGPGKMYKALIFLAVVAAASALDFGLGAPIVNKVNYQPAEYTHVRPEVTVQQPEYQYRSVPVPVPVAQPYYTAPVVRNFVAPPQVVAAPYPGLGFGYGLPAGF